VLDDETLVRVFVGRRSNGAPVYETLWLAGAPGGYYRVVETPLMALGMAREDIIEVEPDGFISQVIERGRFRAIQLVSAKPFSREALTRLARLASQLGGNMDAHDDIMAGLAIPNSVDLDELRSSVAEYASEFPVEAYWDASANPLLQK
jgi:hypothetical protein